MAFEHSCERTGPGNCVACLSEVYSQSTTYASKKVYVVVAESQYDGDMVEGVFASKEKAEAHAQKVTRSIWIGTVKEFEVIE